MVQDSISDFIIRLQNAGNAGNETVLVPYSKLLQKVAEMLEKEGYISGYTKKGKKVSSTNLLVTLSKDEHGTKIKGVKRHSKSSKRVYRHADDIYPVRHGYGTLIISTSKGIMSGENARKEHLGGEVLFEIW